MVATPSGVVFPTLLFLEDNMLFNFEDGLGPVPAHQHPNGGGWVASTATVDETAYVGANARIFGNARIFDNARISDNARVFGNAWVFYKAKILGNAKISGSAKVSGDSIMSIGELVRGYYVSSPVSIMRSDGYVFTIQSDNSIIAGCRDFSWEEAEKHWMNKNHHKHEESSAILKALLAIKKGKEK